MNAIKNEDGSRDVNISIWVPVFAASFAALIGILGTILVISLTSARSEYLTLGVHVVEMKRIDDREKDMSDKISNIASRMASIEATLAAKLVELQDGRRK